MKCACGEVWPANCGPREANTVDTKLCVSVQYLLKPQSGLAGEVLFFPLYRWGK